VVANTTAAGFASGHINGWTPDPKHASDFAMRNPTAFYSGVQGGVLMDAKPRNVFLPQYLMRACRELYGKQWRYKTQYQKRGTCVGQSHKSGADMTMAVSRYIAGTKFVSRAAVAPIYAGSRVEIGNNPGRGDGSNGSWAAEWLTKFGVVTMAEMKLAEDALDDDEQLGVGWTARREGVPAEYEAMAKVKPIKNMALVTTAAEVRAALWNLNFVNICTSLIPGGQRDSEGMSRMRRQGGHSTGIVGCRQVGSNWVYAYLQSWGEWASGTYKWTEFDENNEFSSAIVDISESDLEAVLRSQDCYALSGADGFGLVDPTYYF
jgi:hypothetical protein